MKEFEFTLKKHLNFYDGIALVEGSDLLDSKTSYWLARLKTKIEPLVTPFIKERTRLYTEAQKKNDEKGLTVAKAIQVTEDYNKILDELLDAVQEKMKYPTFKRNQFEAQEDITRVTPNGVVVYKKGQSLVPVKFLTLLADLIEDDEIEY